jgi:hypothetical protein
MNHSSMKQCHQNAFGPFSEHSVRSLSRVALLHSHREYGKVHMGNQQDDGAIE